MDDATNQRASFLRQYNRTPGQVGKDGGQEIRPVRTDMVDDGNAEV